MTSITRSVCVKSAKSGHVVRERLVALDGAAPRVDTQLPGAGHGEDDVLHTESALSIGNHARLMAELTAPGTQASKHDARLRPDALAWNFSRMAKEIDDILSVSYFSTELVNAYEAAHKGRKPHVKA